MKPGLTLIAALVTALGIPISATAQLADDNLDALVEAREIPTPRWTAYDAKIYDVKMPEEVSMTHQERAYTSPIWYRP